MANNLMFNIKNYDKNYSKIKALYFKETQCVGERLN